MPGAYTVNINFFFFQTTRTSHRKILNLFHPLIIIYVLRCWTKEIFRFINVDPGVHYKQFASPWFPTGGLLAFFGELKLETNEPWQLTKVVCYGIFDQEGRGRKKGKKDTVVARNCGEMECNLATWVSYLLMVVVVLWLSSCSFVCAIS